LKQKNAALTARINANGEEAESAAILRERLTDEGLNVQRLIDVQGLHMQNFKVLTANLETANSNVAALLEEKGRLQDTITKQTEQAINGFGTQFLIDPLLFKKLISRCREVNNEVDTLKARLVESEGSSSRCDLQK
jgi:hypothetical protein